MSLPPEGRSHGPDSFPRVSGDEPNKENRMSEITEFSPRERG